MFQYIDTDWFNKVRFISDDHDLWAKGIYLGSYGFVIKYIEIDIIYMVELERFIVDCWWKFLLRLSWPIGIYSVYLYSANVDVIKPIESRRPYNGYGLKKIIFFLDILPTHTIAPEKEETELSYERVMYCC